MFFISDHQDPNHRIIRITDETAFNPVLPDVFRLLFLARGHVV